MAGTRKENVDRKLDLDDLEAKARAATPGPWRLLPDGPPTIVAGTPGDEIKIVGPQIGPYLWNAAHIAAASPDVVLELVARIRKLEQGLDEAARLGKRWLREMDGLLGPDAEEALQAQEEFEQLRQLARDSTEPAPGRH